MDTPNIDSQALLPGTELQEFVIERVLGAGGFGITYLARDTSLGRQVVIKENLPSQFAWRETATGTVRPRHSTGGDVEDYQWSMQNFLREAETLASLDHPGIVRVLRKFETNGTAYFVMPYVEGRTFDGLIDDRKSRNKVFSQEELQGLTTRMLAALDYLHDRGMYHRDIKPANILITMEGMPVLIDFGSARQRLSERSMTVIESPGYTPFEQLQSRGNVGPWSDLYALGATLSKAITFETPPKAADRMMGDPWQGLARRSDLETYSQWFLEAIERAMMVDPAARWQKSTDWSDFLLNGTSRPPLTQDRSMAPSGSAMENPTHLPQHDTPSATRQDSTHVNPYQTPATGIEVENPSGNLHSHVPTSGNQVRPWVRLWARTIDFFLFCFIAGFVIGMVAVEVFYIIPEIVLGVIFSFAYIFVEPAMLATWGTTPGKALLRIALRKNNGSKLEYPDGLSRAFKVWIRGLGLGIPIVGFFTQLNAYSKLTKNGITSWDEEGKIVVSHQKIGPIRVLTAIAILIFMILMMSAGDSY